MAAVPAAQTAGFTSAGIAANSIALGMMSSAAVVNGGSVASGTAVAVLQSVGAIGAVSLGMAATMVAVPTAIGAGVGILKDLHNDTLVSTSAYDPHEKNNQWIVAIEKGPGNVRVIRFQTENEARAWFRKSWSIRELYSPDGKLVASARWNPWAHATIRRVMKEKYFAH
ncbi:putative membrane protein [Phytophthora megakarya]|uniref:Putative membrane protein n=1 Tax=Phytophthora megakarya TaxID=4795 RepID=A0A225W3Q6_9STRA|nr:putative membrane protein [Phytophthora megakarya]